ncbi:MAG: GLUG motif-containing protein, partial [Planctomycetota bacterium]
MATTSNSRILRTITLLITIFSLSFPAYAKYSGGAGEPNEPYKIATAEDLMLLGDSPQDYDKHFIMIDDIDLDPNLPGRKVFDGAVIAPDTDPNTKIYFEGVSFTGVFDGNGHTISNLTIEGGSYIGLFGRIGLGSQVANLGVVDVTVIGGDLSYYHGGLCASNEGTIFNCYASATMSGFEWLGGLCGWNEIDGTISNCYATGSVTGETWYLGGLCGQNDGTISDCYATGSVSGRGYLGGLCGMNKDVGTISNCYATGSVSGNENIGGLCGES